MSTERSELQKEIDNRLVERIATTLLDARRNCLTCEFFDLVTEKCSQAGARPPARVIVLGCELYVRFPF